MKKSTYDVIIFVLSAPYSYRMTKSNEVKFEFSYPFFESNDRFEHDEYERHHYFCASVLMSAAVPVQNGL